MYIKQIARNIDHDSIYYIDEFCVLINGDCKDVLPKLDMMLKPSLIVTDPPYEFESVGGGLYKNSENMRKISDAETDSFEFDLYVMRILEWQSFWFERNKDGTKYANAYFFCNKSLLKRYLQLSDNRHHTSDVLVMKKTRYVPAHNNHYDPDIEYIVFIKSPNATFNSSSLMWGGVYSKVFEYIPTERENVLHPNQKPIGILKKFIDISSSPGDLVIDPFAGSSQTLVAARQLGRYAIGIEKNPEFAIKSAENLSQLSLFS